MVFIKLALTAFDWLLYSMTNGIGEVPISSNHMRILEGASDRRFFDFFFWTWIEIAPPALKKNSFDEHGVSLLLTRTGTRSYGDCRNPT